MQRPVSRALAAPFAAAATEGFRHSMKRYGLMLETLEFAVVNGYIYMCPRGAGAPKGAKGPPPRMIFKLLTKVHPEMRRRIRDVSDMWATKRWREDVHRWDTEWKPALIREHTDLEKVDLGSLTDAQLAAHVDRCFDASVRSIFRHHSLNATTMLPLGDFLAHVADWTGLSVSEVLPLFRGSSRVSRGPVEELDALVAELRRNPDAMTLLDGSDAAAVVEALTSRNDSVGQAARMYVGAAGARVATGYDVADLTFAEMPDVLVKNVRAAAGAAHATESNDLAPLEATIRERVPAEHRQVFDELLAEARFTYRIREERGYLNDAWACGITRRAILEAGKRLARRGRIARADQAVDLTREELISVLQEGPGPSRDEIAAHALYRETHTVDDAPQFLGGVPAGPPPAEWLPPAAARAQRSINTVMAEMFAVRQKQTGTAITGYPASPGKVVGTARLVRTPEDMMRVQQGDILVTRSTTPSYNALLPLISGIVTDRGGTLSHAALVAREYGIPAIVGCGNATELIADGARVRLDGTTGAVEILA